MKELLVTIAVLPMAQQRDKLKVNFDAWKADYEKVYDVLVIEKKNLKGWPFLKEMFSGI